MPKSKLFHSAIAEGIGLKKLSKVNVVDALATAAVLQMGESNEQTPLAIITDVPFVQFQNRNPTEQELQALPISIEDDVYAPLLQSTAWIKNN